MKMSQSFWMMSVFSFLSLFPFSCTPANVVAPDAREGDEDSDPTTEVVDQDGDGYTNTIDCDDFNTAIYPNATELDNGIDDDCDGSIDEGYPIDNDVDNDGYTTDPQDCNDSDPAIHPGATEDCDDGKDNDCDGTIDGADSQCQGATPVPDVAEYTVTIKVTSSGLTKIDFSYGYCSDKDNPADCVDWHQSVVSNSGSVVTGNFLVKSTGTMRFNSSFFVDGDSNPDHWLCEGYSNPILTAKVEVWVEGLYLGDGDVFGVPYASGCSAGLNIETLIEAY